ncbi:hypothetical protein D9758_012581 [Tetrapyrgos nigripes]|uniref:Uncharacterized protein n=1 Tax=Tetrapyrgos nigripes TaxID=182062 RepID=A0A8H5CGV7_9AGAR|nr:hypothetical protein D9758_012581 [Tetrapyrgos nigripes]
MDETDNPLGNLPPVIAEAIQMALSEFIKENLGSLYVMILSGIWLGVSLSLFMALLYTSTSYSRRKPIFILCVIAVGFGTIPSILFLVLLVQTFIGTENATINLAKDVKPYVLSLSFFSFFSSLCVDCILLFRLVAVFPPSRLSPKQLGLIFGPLLAIKVGRIVAVVVCVVNYMKKARRLPSDDPTNLFLIVRDMAEPKAVWSLQLVDNAKSNRSPYVCVVMVSVFSFCEHGDTNSPSHLGQSPIESYSERFRTLFLIAASNFVFPVIFVILELIFMVTPMPNSIPLAAIGVSATNVEVIGVLFATIWASQTADEWKKVQVRKEATAVSAISFATRPVTFVSTRLAEGNDYHSEGQVTTQGGTVSTGLYTMSEHSNIESIIEMAEKQETSVV